MVYNHPNFVKGDKEGYSNWYSSGVNVDSVFSFESSAIHLGKADFLKFGNTSFSS